MKQRHVIFEHQEKLGTHDDIVLLCGPGISVPKGQVDEDDVVTRSGKTACKTCYMKADDEQREALEEACEHLPELEEL